ncbi:MAG TPA: hypothetical protein PL009_12255 [Flavipsychrobacter sp.]|nr:hypothetical protein [Flavipsychrobacter sp.]
MSQSFQPVSTFIAGYDPMAETVIRSVLNRRLSFAGSCNNTQYLEQHLPPLAPRVVALISQTANEAYDDLQQVRLHLPTTPVLVFREEAPLECVVTLFKSGANGYMLHKDQYKLRDALLEIAHKGSYGNDLLVDLVQNPRMQLRPERKDIRLLRALLSEQEYNVVVELAKDPTLTNVRLGNATSKSLSTIEKTLCKIYERLRVSSRAELIALLSQYTLETTPETKVA